jgi:hypothetical protein
MPGCDVEPGKRICVDCPEVNDCEEAEIPMSINLRPDKPDFRDERIRHLEADNAKLREAVKIGIECAKKLEEASILEYSEGTTTGQADIATMDAALSSPEPKQAGEAKCGLCEGTSGYHQPSCAKAFRQL